mgnify:CR=1 FL=1
MKKLPLIEVEWDDIVGQNSWDDLGKDYTSDRITCKTVGWRLKSNRKTIVIASTISKGALCTDRTVIPRSVIKSMRRLK